MLLSPDPAYLSEKRPLSPPDRKRSRKNRGGTIARFHDTRDFSRLEGIRTSLEDWSRVFPEVFKIVLPKLYQAQPSTGAIPCSGNWPISRKPLMPKKRMSKPPTRKLFVREACTISLGRRKRGRTIVRMFHFPHHKEWRPSSASQVDRGSKNA